jgi:hypothetical protein
MISPVSKSRGQHKSRIGAPGVTTGTNQVTLFDFFPDLVQAAALGNHYAYPGLFHETRQVIEVHAARVHLFPAVSARVRGLHGINILNRSFPS